MLVIANDSVPGYSHVLSIDALNRIYTVHPRNDECFYLYLLLVNVRGQTSIENLRIAYGKLCSNIEEPINVFGCQRMILIGIVNAAISSNAQQIRTSFSIIISIKFTSKSIDMWTKYKNNTFDNILNQMHTIISNPDLQFNEEIHNEELTLIEDMGLIISNKVLPYSGMTVPNRPMYDAFN